jgi:hypothetical protein
METDSTWVPPYGGSVATKLGLPGPQWASYTGMTFTAGTVVDYVGFDLCAWHRGNAVLAGSARQAVAEINCLMARR